MKRIGAWLLAVSLLGGCGDQKILEKSASSARSYWSGRRGRTTL